MRHVTPARAGVAAAVGAIALGAMAGTATATRPATQQEINGIVAAVNTYTTARGYTNSRYITDQIRISTASASPLYAAAQIDPTRPNRRTIPVTDVLLAQPTTPGRRGR